MRKVFFVLCVLMIVRGGLPAASKEIVQLQRDVALLQDQVRTLQRTLDEKVAALTVLLEQTLDRTNKLNTAVAVLEASMKDRLNEQQKTIALPVAGLSSKLDQFTTEFSYVREAVADVSSRMGRLEQRVNDMSTAVQTLNAPPPPPGSEGGAPAGVSARQLYENAERDRSGGNLDLALQQYQDYLKYFGNTELAPNAQYQIGEIHYLRGNFEEAAQAFDLVLEKYPENAKTPDAFYMKGMALMKAGKRTAASREFYELVGRYPNSPAAAKARNQLRAMGLSTTPPRAKPRG